MSDKNRGGEAVGTSYWGPNPVQYKGVHGPVTDTYTYCASEVLVPASGSTVLTGNFTFPEFKSIPRYSMQITTSVDAIPVQIYAVKISEVPVDANVSSTNFAIEATTGNGSIPAGIYHLNILVTGATDDPVPLWWKNLSK